MKHIQVATSQIGLEEIPRNSNWGEHVKKYLNSVGINFPASWCMAFVYWCCKEAYGTANPLKKTGGVLSQWNQTPKDKRSFKPVVGSIFIMDFGKGLGHTGFVTGIEGDYIKTIEGNTDSSGSRNGFEVAVRKRKISTIKGYILLPQ